MAGRRDAGARARPTPRRRRGRALRGGDDGAAASRDRGGRCTRTDGASCIGTSNRRTSCSSTATAVPCCGCSTSASRRSWRAIRSVTRGSDAAAARPDSRRTTRRRNRSRTRERARGPTSTRWGCCSASCSPASHLSRPTPTSSCSSRSCPPNGRRRRAGASTPGASSRSSRRRSRCHRASGGTTRASFSTRSPAA